MDEFREHALTTEHISKVRAKLRDERKKSSLYKMALDIAIKFISGDGYPGKDAQAALKQINKVLEELK